MWKNICTFAFCKTREVNLFNPDLMVLLKNKAVKNTSVSHIHIGLRYDPHKSLLNVLSDLWAGQLL